MESPWLNTLNAMLPDFTFPPVPQQTSPRDMHRWEAAVRVNLDYWGVSDVLEGDPHAAQVASVWFRGLERIDWAFNTVADGLVGWVPRWAARVSGVDEVVGDQEPNPDEIWNLVLRILAPKSSAAVQEPRTVRRYTDDDDDHHEDPFDRVRFMRSRFQLQLQLLAAVLDDDVQGFVSSWVDV